MGKVQGICLHTAHVLCMDAILSVGLEMGSHNQDCWPHVFRYEVRNGMFILSQFRPYFHKNWSFAKILVVSTYLLSHITFHDCNCISLLYLPGLHSFILQLQGVISKLNL